MSTFNPMLDYARVEQRVTAQPERPMYPGWYDPSDYKRPDPARIHEEGMRLYDSYQFQRAALRVDQELLRMMRQGVFDNDEDDLTAGILEDYVSTALVDDYHLAVSIMSGIDPFFPIESRDDEKGTYYRQKRAACEWLFDVEARAHTRTGEIPTNILIPKLLLERGAIVSRRTLNRYAETGDSPFIRTFIDPTEVIPHWEGWKGLGAVYRVFAMTYREVCREFGDLSEGQEKKIRNLLGSDITDESYKCDIVEYWDRRWRVTTMAGAVLIPPTEHNYGETPYTIGYGPLGEPQLLRLPTGSTYGPETLQQMLQYKTNTFIWSKKHPHLFNEAMMKRYVLAFQKMLHPAAIASLDPNFKGDLEPLDSTPGAMNKEKIGVAQYKPLPPMQDAFSAQVLMQQISSQVQTGFAPPTAYGYMPDQANISGTANRASLAAGLHLHRPWISAEQSFIAEDMSKAMRLIRNFGSVVEYGEVNRYKPIMAPVNRPSRGDPNVARLNRALLDKTGTDVTVRMVIKDKDSWVQMAQAANLLKQQGVPFQYLAEELFAIPYDDQMREEWKEEMAEEAMYRHPKFMELGIIPEVIEDLLEEAEGDDARAQRLFSLRDRWEKYIVQPAEMELNAKNQQMQQAMAPPPQQNMNPPTTEGVSLPDLGQGPGSVTGNQGGRPPGMMPPGAG